MALRTGAAILKQPVKRLNVSHGSATGHAASVPVSHDQGHDSATGYAASELVAAVFGFVSQR